VVSHSSSNICVGKTNKLLIGENYNCSAFLKVFFKMTKPVFSVCLNVLLTNRKIIGTNDFQFWSTALGKKLRIILIVFSGLLFEHRLILPQTVKLLRAIHFQASRKAFLWSSTLNKIWNGTAFVRISQLVLFRWWSFGKQLYSLFQFLFYTMLL